MSIFTAKPLLTDEISGAHVELHETDRRKKAATYAAFTGWMELIGIA